MNGHILALGTAVPKYSATQKQVLEKTLSQFSFDPQTIQTLRNLYENSGIQTRHSVIADYLRPPEDRTFMGATYPENIPGMATRNDIYKQEATPLAHNAAEKALKAWGGDPSSITHIISTSCTGVVIPGIEFSLISTLGLKRSIHRLGINFMGCFGAFKALEVANAFAQQNPNNRILVVCTELCSLHIQATNTQDSLLANSIFADGSAAAIVGSQPTTQERPLWEMVRHQSHGLENSEEQMRWEAGDHGYAMKLSNFVPVSISRHILGFSERLLSSHTSIKECDWPIHPGGRAVLQTIEKKLQLSKEQTTAAWSTLANYGNMSSATFLFVLENLAKQSNKKSWAAGLGFGPGLSFEGILLRDSQTK